MLTEQKLSSVIASRVKFLHDLTVSEVTIEEMMHMYKNEIIKNAPCGVFFDRHNSNSNVHSFVSEPYTGYTKTNYSIVIRNDLNINQRLTTFMHELGHYFCAKNNCYCMVEYTWATEYHADVFAVNELKMLGYKTAIRALMKMNNNIMRRSDLKNTLYSSAAKKLLRTSLYKKCNSMLASFCK